MAAHRVCCLPLQQLHRAHGGPAAPVCLTMHSFDQASLHLDTHWDTLGTHQIRPLRQLAQHSLCIAVVSHCWPHTHTQHTAGTASTLSTLGTPVMADVPCMVCPYTISAAQADSANPSSFSTGAFVGCMRAVCHVCIASVSTLCAALRMIGPKYSRQRKADT